MLDGKAFIQMMVSFFANPVVWLAIFASIGMGYQRVKRERQHFRIRLQSGRLEWRQLVGESWVVAVVLSILMSGIGIVVTVEWFVIASLLVATLLLFATHKILSPIYFMGLSIVAIWLLDKKEWTLGNWDFSIHFSIDLVVTVVLFASLALVAEGFLIWRKGASIESPFLVNTRRGGLAALFKVKKLWLLPIVVVVPGTWVSASSYWPQFTIGQEEFTFLLFPLVIGYSQVVRKQFVDVFLPAEGKRIMGIGFIVLVVAIIGIWYPVASWCAVGFGLVARLVLSITHSISQRRGAFITAPSSRGVVIVGILENSPGERMALQVGEIIRSVNGIDVQTEKELYQAIQVNAAHCRLQVIDRAGEVRLVQQIIYRHDHHRLGLLVI